MKTVHELKTISEHFNNVLAGLKPFEVRNDDRNFQVGDELLLKEYSPHYGCTGNWIKAGVLLKLKNEYCREGYCVMSLYIIDVGGVTLSNYQGIRNMTIEQLAEFLEEYSAQGKQDSGAIKEWLEQPINKINGGNQND